VAISSQAADRIAGAVGEASLAALVREALERNPAVAAAAARTRAARQQAPQAKALPDPVLGATGYLAPPETRVGPQRLMTTLSQRLPWFGKLGLREQAALQQAEALEAELEARRLDLVTEVRRLYHEIAFVDAYRAVLQSDRETLIHYEELARARYASGVGLEQGVVKIQAEITRDDTRLLDIETRRAALAAALNALLDRPQETPVPVVASSSRPSGSAPPIEALRARALEARPELARSDAEIRRANTMIELARKEYKPDVTLGVTYTAVGERGDQAGILQPPPDNGSDVFGVNLSLNLPIRRGRLAAGVEEAAERRLDAVERRRDAVAGIDRALGELAERVRLTGEQAQLFSVCCSSRRNSHSSRPRRDTRPGP
jgi:outer membrane protein TolC